MLSMLSTVTLGFYARAAVPSYRAGLLTPAASIRFRGGAVTMSAESEIKGIIASMIKDGIDAGKDAAKIDACHAKYYSADCEVIRPSGNPMSMKMWKEMMLSDDVVATSDELQSVDSVKMIGGGNAAVATYVSHAKFTYKGTPNDDIAKFTAVFDKTADGWKCVAAHRATGQAPK